MFYKFTLLIFSQSGINMPLACMLITHFPMKAELSRNSALDSKPVIIVEQSGRRQLVMDYSVHTSGVSIGMPIQEALSVCKDVILLESNESYYEETFESLLQNMESRSPIVEKYSLGHAYIGLDGLEPMYGGEARLITNLMHSVPSYFNPRMGVSESKFPAYLAALTSVANGSTKVPDNIIEFLKEFSIKLLPISWKTKSRFIELGISTLGHIAEQPIGAIQAQFGREGTQAWELSNGIDKRFLFPRKPQEMISEDLIFPYPQNILSGILIAIDSLITKAFSHAYMKNKYARKIQIESNIINHPTWIKQFNYKQPVNKDGALKIIRNSLQNTNIPGPLEDMKVTLIGITGESGIQTNMLSNVREQERLKEIIYQAQVRWGNNPLLYIAKDVEPWSPIPERKTILVPFVS